MLVRAPMYSIFSLIFQDLKAYESISYNKYDGFMPLRQEKKLVYSKRAVYHTPTSITASATCSWVDGPCEPQSPHFLRRLGSSTEDIGYWDG